MQTVKLVIEIVMVVAAVLLVISVLLQDAKSAGLGAAFGNDTTAFGRNRSQKASKQAKLQKMTVILAIIVGVLALVLLMLGA